MKRKLYILLPAGIALIILIFFAGYSAWNAGNPESTCASCHEINPSLETWQMSAHREINCLECHGSALSNGFHSLKEKSRMVLTHVKKKTRNSDIRLSENQIIDVMSRCNSCHQEEFKKWKSGGHSATYAHIFLDEDHNRMEQPYWDCFRCHGMHYEGNIYELVEPISTEGPWSLIDEEKSDDPVMTCMACHEIHTDNDVRQLAKSFDEPRQIFYERKTASEQRFPKAGLYVRADKIFLRADHLPQPDIFVGNRQVKINPNPAQRVCMQCHAPNWQHQAGSQDDRTPSGVHEGLACMACHETHSNDASNSCDQCHPVISNCGIDHKTMNTSYFNPDSPNNIHHVSCDDCHEDNI